MSALNWKKEEFERSVLEEGKISLVEFWAPWCVYCRRIGPALDKVAQEKSGELLIAKVNIDEEPSLAEKYQVEVIPTLILYKEGKELGSIVAPESKAKIEEFISEYAGK